MTMREVDKEIIRAAGRDEEWDAVLIFKEKIWRRWQGRVHIGSQFLKIDNLVGLYRLYLYL